MKNRTKFDPNEIILDYRNNYAYICLYNNKGQKITRTIIE
jgi:hypothetical protein